MNYASYILYVIDTETTSLDVDKGEIIELSIKRLNDNSQKTWYIKPSKYDKIESDALRINGHKLEDLKHETVFGKETYKLPSNTLPDIENWIMEDLGTSSDRVFVGQNPTFDLRFLEKFWKDYGSVDMFPFGKRPQTIDTKELALVIDILSNKRREYYNLSSLVSDFGIKKEKAHKAENDVKMTADLFHKELEILASKKFE